MRIRAERRSRSGRRVGFRRLWSPARIAGLAASLAACAPLAAQSLSRSDRERGRVMLEQVREDIERKYYDPSYGGYDLRGKFAAAQERMRTAASLDEVMSIIAQLAVEMGDSHTFFVPPLRTIRADYGWEMRIVGDSSFVTEVRRDSDAARQGLAVGDAVVSINGYQPSRANLWQLRYLFDLLRPQRSLRVVVQSPGGAPRQLDLAARAIQRKRVLDLTGQDGGDDIWAIIRDLESSSDRYKHRYAEVGERIAVWKMPLFESDRLNIRDLSARARKRESLILDLRGNSGGAEKSLLSLVGLFFDADRQIATLRRRKGNTPLVAKSSGNDRITGTVVVLIDSESASASEILARTFQLTGRGKVIGDRSAGAVMRSRAWGHMYGGETAVFYATSVTDADVIMPDGGRLEGQGVTPDEIILPSSSDLAAGRDPVLARALAMLGVTTTPAQAGELLTGTR